MSFADPGVHYDSDMYLLCLMLIVNLLIECKEESLA